MSPPGSSHPAIFRLLVPATDEALPAITILGRRWTLTEPAPLPGADHGMPYTAISYAYGPGRRPHPFAGYPPMSDRTVPAMETVLQARTCDALWVDSFCLPTDESGRAESLRTIGTVYARATRIVAVLSTPCSIVLEQIAASTNLDEAALMALDRDDWISRVWTYHEVVNGNRVHFMAMGRSASAEAEDLLRALADFQETRGSDGFALAACHPGVARMVDLLLDWKAWAYLDRSAYQVLASTQGRGATRPEDHFYALFGALVGSRKTARAHADLHPAEAFMQLCEALGDYSFLYVTGPRDRALGRYWRPRAGPLFEVVLPWPSYGQGQAATVLPTHIHLERMWLPAPGRLLPTAASFIRRWLKRTLDACSDEDLAAAVLDRLRSAGFSGCSDVVELESGFFFPYTRLCESRDVTVAVAVGVRTTFGAVGLALGRGTPFYEVRTVGVFVGAMQNEHVAIDVA